VATATRDWHYMKTHFARAADVKLEDVSNLYAVLGVMGPNSRKVLSKLTGADLSNEAYPFGTAKKIEFGWAKALALRISYVGELGWEIYLPSDYAPGALDLLLEAGREFGLKPAGMHAMNFLRLEKAYRHWGHDISPDDTPHESGLAFLCAMDKAVPFIGREAVAAEKGRKLTKRLVQLALQDPRPLLYHNEPIFLDGRNVGYVTSAGYGFTENCAIGMGYVRHPDGVDQALVEGARFEVMVADEKVPARASLKPFYDPKGERLKM
jgi:glycine cleavage system aminomethyltransferase T